MHRNRTTTGLLLAGLLGLLLAGLGVFPSPWPWVVVLGFGALRPLLAGLLRARDRQGERAYIDLGNARALAEDAGIGLRKQVAQWEQRLDGTLSPEESKQVRADFNAMVQRMAELEAQVAEAVKEQRARALAAPFSEVA